MSIAGSLPTDPPAPAPTPPPPNGIAPKPDVWDKLRFHHPIHNPPPVQNANDVANSKLSPLDKLAAAITDKVGSMGFFFFIVVWTILWTGYNILASEVPGLKWKAFDPFPAFVAYLLISNVIQIMLMPLIMVGQNVQSRHSEIRAQLDFEINQKAEKEIIVILKHLEHNTDLVIQLMKHLECRIPDDDLHALEAERDLAAKLESVNPAAEAPAA